MPGLKTMPRLRRSLFVSTFIAAALAPFGAAIALAGPTQTTIWQFPIGGVDGNFPVAGVVGDAHGNLYGTTTAGGNGYGTVYELSPPTGGQSEWTEQTLHIFDGQDGAYPKANLLIGPDGSIYGTTYEGGSNNEGLVFKISNSVGYPYTVLHNFDLAHGAYPQAGLTFGSDGLLYGTTPADAKTPIPAAGTAFSLSPQGDRVEFKSFAPFGRSTPGGGPSNLTRILPGPSAPASDFIGTTDPGPIGLGPYTVFLLRTNNGGIGGASVAYTFGVTPGDVTDADGAPIQGTAALHGLYFGCALFGGANGHGGVYQLTPTGAGTFSEKILFSFGRPSATEPSHACSIVQGSSAGTIYGTTDGSGDGVLFALSPPTTPGGAWTETDLTDFYNAYSAEGSLARMGNELFQTFEYPYGSVVEITR